MGDGFVGEHRDATRGIVEDVEICVGGVTKKVPVNVLLTTVPLTAVPRHPGTMRSINPHSYPQLLHMAFTTRLDRATIKFCIEEDVKLHKLATGGCFTAWHGNGGGGAGNAFPVSSCLGHV